jgi:predicted transcriptional regulator
MLTKARVRDYMAQHLVTLRPDDEVLRAINTLIEHKIAGAPVIDENRNLVGLLTEKDCMQVVVNATYHSEYAGLVADFMSTEVEVIDAEDTIINAAKRFLNKRYHRYPVMHENRLVGQISRSDVIRALGDVWQ